MAKRRRKKRKLERIYVVRRIVLFLVAIGLIGILIWTVLFSKSGANAPDKTDDASTSESEMPSAPSTSEPEEDENTDDATSDDTETSDDEKEGESSKLETSANTDTGTWKLLLVNAASPLPDGFSVDLETLEGYQMDKRIVDPVLQMFTAAKESGIDLMLCSGYRSTAKQEENYQRALDQYRAQGLSDEEAIARTDDYYARPGESEHHTGLALDIVTPSYQTLDEGYAETPAAQWLSAHAHEYGFVLRYPKSKESITQINYEPWHFRYVGPENAAAMKENGYCLEEYVRSGLE